MATDTQAEREAAARAVHAAWVAEKQRQGKTHPHMIPWAELSEAVRAFDYATVDAAWPIIYAAGRAESADPDYASESSHFAAGHTVGRAEVDEALFQQGDFLLAGGSRSSWKIECDALTSEDWATLAMMAVEQGLTFSGALGVPRGGIPFADALRPYASDGPVLIVDDVLTTGGSILRLMSEHPGSVGLVAFARGPLPDGVHALWAARTATRLAEAGDDALTLRRQVAELEAGTQYQPHTDRIAELERDLETAQHNQDMLARPFDAGGQMDQVQERIEVLEGALRDAVRYIDSDTESWRSDEFEAKVKGWRALLPKASEGDERA